MYRSYGYGSGADTAMVIISVLALVAYIALSIILYIKFLGKNSDRSSGLGRFFHFDHFYIEQFLRILYLLGVVSITVSCVWLVLSAAFGTGSIGGFLLSLVLAVVLFAFSQFVCRIMFEASLIVIRQAVDVRALRSKVVGDVPAPKNSAASHSPVFGSGAGGMRQQHATGGAGGTASSASSWANSATQSKSQPASQADKPDQVFSGYAPDPDLWTCTCGNTSVGAFCGRCGQPRP